MGEILKESAIVFIIGALLLASGCISHLTSPTTTPISPVSSPPITSGITESQPTANFTYQHTPDPSHWIEIDPIRNFHRDFGLKNNPLVFNISGKTNLPVGSSLWINVYPCDRSSSNLLVDYVTVEQTGGDNTFFHAVNVTNAMGGERITINEYCTLVKWKNIEDTTRFNVSVEDPILWIRIDPVGIHHIGETLNITGITNLPTGSEITIKCEPVNLFPCPLWAKENPSNFSGTICGSDCDPGSFSKIIPVDRANGGNNTWAVSVDTTGWCWGYRYSIGALKKGWDNVSISSEDLRFRQE